MKKIRIISFLCVLALMFGALTTVVGAAAPQTANGPSYATSIKERLANSIAEAANNLIYQLVENAQNNPNANIDLLVALTNGISQTAINIINALGFDAECVYEPFVINGQTVYIDPIIVIKR